MAPYVCRKCIPHIAAVGSAVAAVVRRHVPRTHQDTSPGLWSAWLVVQRTECCWAELPPPRKRFVPVRVQAQNRRSPSKRLHSLTWPPAAAVAAAATWLRRFIAVLHRTTTLYRNHSPSTARCLTVPSTVTSTNYSTLVCCCVQWRWKQIVRQTTDKRHFAEIFPTPPRWAYSTPTVY